MASLFAAIIAAGAFISIPLPFSPVPITLQNLFVILAGLVTGPLTGTLAVAVFLTAGALGAPVFSGMRGGMTVKAGPTGGFLAGYLLAAFLAGLIAKKPDSRDFSQSRFQRGRRIACAVLISFMSMYIPGLLRLHAVIHPQAFLQSLGSGWIRTLSAGFFPFIPGMIIKMLVAVPVAMRLRRFIVHTDDADE